MLGVSRSSTGFLLRSLTLSVILGGISVVACSSSETPATPTCDDAKCKPGNRCLPLNGVTECRKTCASNADPATSCPFGYTCVDTESGYEPFCVQNTGAPVVKKQTGQWGSPCQANLGVENPGCDTEQGFYCYGIAPTDGNAYCTRYDCEKDSDCGAGFWCGKINKAPNVATAKRGTIGEVQQVCLKREYCATCRVDLDCPPIAGKPQHCVADANGARLCSPECDDTKACPNEAKCLSAGDYKVCYPRAGVCVGDGSLCSPCRVDTDCGEDGACVKGQYTTERTCAKKAPSSCGNKDKPEKGGCPDKADGSGANIGCYGFFFEQVPENYCHGLYGLDQSFDIGCYTPKR